MVVHVIWNLIIPCRTDEGNAQVHVVGYGLSGKT